MNEKELEYKMYGLVAYQLCGTIHAGIQFGHAAVRYGRLMDTGTIDQTLVHGKWADIDQTFIILNGGTTNENPDRLGTMQQHAATLKANGITIAEFREPDLNDTLTAIVFLVDERVFNKEKHPDRLEDKTGDWIAQESVDSFEDRIGGLKNLFLRSFLSQFKKA